MDKKKADKLRIAVIHDWIPSPRLNAFGEDMRPDQINNDVAELILQLLNEQPDVIAELVSAEKIFALFSNKKNSSWNGAVNLAYGEYGRFHMAEVPMMLDRLGVPNYGANPLLMSLTRNKQQTKNIAESIGIKTSPSVFYDYASAHLVDAMPSSILPAIVKPNEAASGLGIEAIAYQNTSDAKCRAHDLLNAYPEGIIVEKFVSGMELTVAALSTSKKIDTFAYVLKNSDGSDLEETYMNAYKENLGAYVEGCRIWKDMEKEGLYELAQKAKSATENLVNELRFIGFSRADFRVEKNGGLVFLELNGQAGISLGPSVVTTIGADHFENRLGFINAFAANAVEYLREVISDSPECQKSRAN